MPPGPHRLLPAVGAAPPSQCAEQSINAQTGRSKGKYLQVALLQCLGGGHGEKENMQNTCSQVDDALSYAAKADRRRQKHTEREARKQKRDAQKKWQEDQLKLWHNKVQATSADEPEPSLSAAPAQPDPEAWRRQQAWQQLQQDQWALKLTEERRVKEAEAKKKAEAERRWKEHHAKWMRLKHEEDEGADASPTLRPLPVSSIAAPPSARPCQPAGCPA